MNFEMYQDNILDHYENPSHQGTLEHPTFEIRDLNPLCGDEVRIQARLDDEGRLAAVRFEGKGCVISLAAASMLMEAGRGENARRGQKDGTARYARSARGPIDHDAREMCDAAPTCLGKGYSPLRGARDDAASGHVTSPSL